MKKGQPFQMAIGWECNVYLEDKTIATMKGDNKEAVLKLAKGFIHCAQLYPATFGITN